MKVSELLTIRRENWKELERLCAQMESRTKKSMGAVNVARFATLYRSACADLALADSYQLPTKTVHYLHRLVGRAHNQLHRSRTFDFKKWSKSLLVDVPRTVFQDGCVQVCFCIFWGIFLASAFLAWNTALWPEFAESVLGESHISQMQDNFGNQISGRDSVINPFMTGFYIYHNTGIGLKCFASGIFVIAGLLTTSYNALVLGASFGYMARPDVPEGANFFHFVTAHGPFELTAIVLSAGAGLRIGMGWIKTDGLTRIASLTKTAREAMPIMGSAILLFFFAAFIEGFISPAKILFLSPKWSYFLVKAPIAVISSGLLMFYFVVLGFPRGDQDATG